MHFLVDASLPRSTAPLIRSRGHDATDVRDIGMSASLDQDIAAHAQANQFAIIMRDYDFADIRNYPPDLYYGIVVVELPSHAVIPDILNLIDAFLQRQDILQNLVGRLAIVEPGRIRLRPTP